MPDITIPMRPIITYVVALALIMLIGCGSGNPTPGAYELEEGYVRLTFKVEGGHISITEVKGVPGPLISQQDVRGGELVYEVRRSHRRLAAGAVPPDALQVRGLPHPEGTGEMAGHQVVERETFEFTARIPKRDLSIEAFRELSAAVYRAKDGETLDIPASNVPILETEASERLLPVAETQGFDLEDLSPDLQGEIRAALQ